MRLDRVRPSLQDLLNLVTFEQYSQLEVVECLRKDGSGTCCIAGICKLQNALRRATEVFLNELDQLTLADLVENEGELNERLGIAQE